MFVRGELGTDRGLTCASLICFSAAVESKPRAPAGNIEEFVPEGNVDDFLEEGEEVEEEDGEEEDR